MDGSNKSTILNGSDYPEGITVDFQMSRIYSAATVIGEIRSSNFDGSGARYVTRISEDARLK